MHIHQSAISIKLQNKTSQIFRLENSTSEHLKRSLRSKKEDTLWAFQLTPHHFTSIFYFEIFIWISLSIDFFLLYQVCSTELAYWVDLGFPNFWMFLLCSAISCEGTNLENWTEQSQHVKFLSFRILNQWQWRIYTETFWRPPQKIKKMSLTLSSL